VNASEFIILVLWLFAPAVCIGAAALWLWTRRSNVSKRRTWVAGAVAVPLAVVLGVASLAIGSAWLPPWLGVHDANIFGWYTMWSPMPFLAVVLVLPVALCFASRNERPR
jgi:hypothetical protein